MASLQRRALRNEENLYIHQNTKNIGKPSTRTALSNISNIQRRPSITGKKKEVNSIAEEKAPVKHLGRAKAQTNLKPATLPVHDEVKKCEPSENINLSHENDLSMDSMIDSFTELDIEDIDADDYGNPSLCSEYVKDIYKYMLKIEKRLLPGDYISTQTEINIKMRAILVDWLIQVQSRFNLLQETLYLTIYILDRFLNKHIVKRSELQLVGVTAMLLASKYEEMYAPEIGDFVYITDNAYSKEKIRQMEQKMLHSCEYDFSHPLGLHFLRRNSKAGSVDAQKHTLAKFLMELTLVDYQFVTILPSKIAAAALYLSIKLIDDSVWTPTLTHYSGFSEKELLPTVSKLSQIVYSIDSNKTQAVKTKYAGSKFLRVSRLPVLKSTTIKKLAELSLNS